MTRHNKRKRILTFGEISPEYLHRTSVIPTAVQKSGLKGMSSPGLIYPRDKEMNQLLVRVIYDASIHSCRLSSQEDASVMLCHNAR